MAGEGQGQGTGEGTGEGTGTGEGQQGQGAEGLGWLSALTTEQQANDWVKGHSKPPEFVDSALKLKTENEALKSKVEKATFKPGENATKEEIATYRKAEGIPDKPEDYVFPEIEGSKNSPEMVKWAQGVFHEAELSKDKAEFLGKSWNSFMKQMGDEQDKSLKEAKEAAEKKAKEELGGEEKYKEASELVTRLLKETATEGELEHLQNTGVGNDPVVVRLIFNMAKKTGEDISPKGEGKGGSAKKGFSYNKSPAPPNNN